MIMGRRSQDIDNIENISPKQKELNISKNSMKTRSSKSKAPITNANSEKTANCSDYDHETVALIEDLSSSSNVIEIEIPYESSDSKSPLGESSCNEQTPEKEELQVANKPSGPAATPTANLRILCDVADHDESTSSESLTVPLSQAIDPVTPTANLKMLITAASPEIRSLELSKSRLFADDEEDEDDELYEEEETPKRSNSKAASATRKQKSLGVLCRRFMAQFDENPPQTSRIEVCLDELATHLGTERRRIYDIVNVLESVEIMSRRAKNRYLWHGKTNLNATLVKLKYFAETERVAKQLELVRELEIARLYGRKSKNNGLMQSEEEAVSNHPKYKEYMELFGDAHRKERSLGVMSQKFLMLFLTGRTKTINLDMAAKILLGDPMVETKQTNSQFKTKIRRLYDIANILASINLVCKVHVTELRGRKPAFSYIGPDVEELSSLDEYQYLKNVEVVRPGRTTLDMKMEELKKKMEAHIAAEQEAAANYIRQVPPVTVQAPDMEEIKQSMLPGRNSGTLSLLAGEHAAKKDARSRELKPKPFVVIQGIAGGSASVVTTSKAPNFVDLSQYPTVSSASDQFTGVTLVPVQTLEGNLYMATASPQLMSPVNNASNRTRRILPQGVHPQAVTTQTLTLYTPPSKTGGQPVTVQAKRTASQALEMPAGQTFIQGPDGTFSTFFLSKSDNEYFLINKKAKGEGDNSGQGQEAEQGQDSQETDLSQHSEQEAVSVEIVSEETVASSNIVTQVGEVQEYFTPMTTHLSPVPVPLIYSTPSVLRTLTVPSTSGVLQGVNNSSSETTPITGTQITFLTSPIMTPVGTSAVSLPSTVTSTAATVVETTAHYSLVNSVNQSAKQPVAIRKLTLK